MIIGNHGPGVLDSFGRSQTHNARPSQCAHFIDSTEYSIGILNIWALHVGRAFVEMGKMHEYRTLMRKNSSGTTTVKSDR
jgi:hypothetical protein